MPAPLSASSRSMRSTTASSCKCCNRSGPQSRRRRAACAPASSRFLVGPPSTVIARNPARWRGHLQHLLPAKSKVRTVEHHAAMPYAEVAAFMTKLRQQEGLAARALELLILCSVRTGDILGGDRRGDRRDDVPPMRWADIDVENRVWTIP